MATLPVESVVRPGLEATKNAVSASDVFPNDGRTIIRVDNQNAATCTVTIVTPGSVDNDLAIPDRDVVLLTTEDRYIGPFPKGTYNDGSGDVTLQFSVTPSVTVEVLKF